MANVFLSTRAIHILNNCSYMRSVGLRFNRSKESRSLYLPITQLKNWTFSIVWMMMYPKSQHVSSTGDGRSESLETISWFPVHWWSQSDGHVCSHEQEILRADYMVNWGSYLWNALHTPCRTGPYKGWSVEELLQQDFLFHSGNRKKNQARNLGTMIAGMCNPFGIYLDLGIFSTT